MNKTIGLLLCAALTTLATACARATPSANNATSIPASATSPAIVITFAETATPSPTPPPPTPTPTPTPQPREIVASADRAMFEGRYEDAAATYARALELFGGAQTDDAKRARLESAKATFAAGDAQATIAFLSSRAQKGALTPDERILLGRAHQLKGEPANALPHFQAAIASGSAMSPTLNRWIGDAHLALNQPVSAVLPLSRAVEGFASNVNMLVGQREALALAHQLNGNFDAALAQYDAILSVARIPSYRARIIGESAKLLQAAGKLPQAHARMRELISQFPDTPAAFYALNALLQAGQPVDELQRGIVDYHNDEYLAAQQAFVRAINEAGATSLARANEIRWWAALNYIRLGNFDGATRNLNQIIASSATSPRFADALLQKGDYLALTGNTADALAAYQQLPKSLPSASQSATAMQRAARLLDRTAQLDDASAAYLAAQRAYPFAEGGDEMLLRAAMAQYRLGQFANSISTTGHFLSAYPNSSFAPAAQLWQAKSQLKLNDPGATTTLNALAKSRPESYEGARALDLLADPIRPPLSTTLALSRNALAQTCAPSPLNTPVCEPNDDGKADAESWLRSWLNISSTVDVTSARADIAKDARFVHGNELWRLGFMNEARIEFESLRASLTRDPLAMWQLALHFRDIGLFRSSISAADALVRLSPARNTAAAPAFVGRLVYPAYYADLVSKNAQSYGVNPLVMFSLIRQESLFEPFAESTAAARGLMQVIPSTGQAIARQVKLDRPYDVGDLTKPYVSVLFGAHYLSSQRNAFGDWFSALAAYNAGPGNAARWRQNNTASDPDVFAALIPFNETSRYVRNITANFREYMRLYSAN